MTVNCIYLLLLCFNVAKLKEVGGKYLLIFIFLFFFSGAVSIKMNVLLFAPSLLLLMVKVHITMAPCLYIFILPTVTLTAY